MQRLTSYKGIWEISFPIILSLIAQQMIVVADTAFLGRVGEVELGASALAGIFYVALFMTGFGFGSGAQIMISKRNGEKLYDQIGSIFSHAFYFLILLAITLFSIEKLIGGTILNISIHSAEVRESAKIYLDIRIYGLFFAFVNTLFRFFYIGITQTRVLSIVAILMAIVNISLDYVLIFGVWGFPEMGIAGAALASVISEASATLFFIFFTYRTIDVKKYKLFNFNKPDFKAVGKLLSLSVYIMFQYFISLSAWFTFFIFIEKLGERSLASANIIRSIYMILMIPGWAFGSAVSTLVGNMIGEGNYGSVMPVIKKVALMSLITMSFSILLGVLFPEQLLRVYTNNQDLIRFSLPSLYVVLIGLFVFSFNQVFFSAISGTGNTLVALIIEIGTLIIYLTSAYLLAIQYKQPVHVIWICEAIYFGLLGIASMIYLSSGHWKKKVF
ncbi:MAG: MATE family efflux transporter [Bacteroidales bacterium]|nr:MATE family efflux transporter [Bacteroidales bacterium]